jgi:hypothetical protein
MLGGSRVRVGRARHTVLSMDGRPAHDEDHETPPGVDDATVEAVGRLTEALETVERARGHLYSFHQLTGEADFKIGDAVDMLREAGHAELAEDLSTRIVGRNVLPGRWTFQVVEEYDDGYWQALRDAEREVRDSLVGGRRHLAESRLKDERRTEGHPGHARRPAEG